MYKTEAPSSTKFAKDVFFTKDLATDDLDLKGCDITPQLTDATIRGWKNENNGFWGCTLAINLKFYAKDNKLIPSQSNPYKAEIVGDLYN